jgi:hypothetical protein
MGKIIREYIVSIGDLSIRSTWVHGAELATYARTCMGASHGNALHGCMVMDLLHMQGHPWERLMGMLYMGAW